MIDQNGIPSIDGSHSTASGTAIGIAVIIPAVTSATFGSMVNDLLATIDDKVVIVVDPNTRKVWTRSVTPGALSTACDDGAVKTVVLTPDSGQTGKSLMFSKGSTTGVDATLVAAIDASIGAQKPKRSVQSLVSNLLGQTLPTVPPVIEIDQVNEVVKVHQLETATDIDDFLKVLTTTDTDQVAIQFTEPASHTSNPLVFEGGAV